MKIEDKIDTYLTEEEILEGFFTSVKSLKKTFDKIINSEFTDKVKKNIKKLFDSVKKEIDKQAYEMSFGKNQKKAQGLKRELVVLLDNIRKYMKDNDMECA